MTFIVRGRSFGIPSGSAPVWNTDPSPAFADEAVAENYDLDQHASGAVSYAFAAGSASRPTGITISGTNIVYDGLGSDGVTAGIIVTATNEDGTTDSSTFAITIIATAASGTFPIFAWYEALVTYRGGTVVPLSNTRFWDKPTYPTSFDSTSTTVSNFNTAIAAASAGDTLALQDGTFSGKITVAVSGTEANPITIVAVTQGGVDMQSSEIQVDGDFVNVFGFNSAIYDANGTDGVIAFGTRDATVTTDFVSDGIRNRFCYNKCTGKEENDQYWNVEKNTPPDSNRIDHNEFFQHIGSDLPSGGSEMGGAGQNNLGDDYWLYYDNNYHVQHLNDGFGGKTVNLESELITMKGDNCMIVQNIFHQCNTHVSIRAGAKCTIYANWFIGTAADRPGGIVAGGKDNLAGANFFFETNDDDAAGEGCFDIFGGDPSNANREEADNFECIFNTGWDIKRGIIVNRTSLATDPTNVQFYSNAFEEKTTRDVDWGGDGTSPVWGANVFNNKNISDSDVVEATPAMDDTAGTFVTYKKPTSAGNCDGTSDAISVMGPITQALSDAGVLVDIIGTVIPTTSADQGAIQASSVVSGDPLQVIIDAAGPD